MGRRLEDRSLVVGKHRQPGLQIRCMVRPRLEFWRDAKVGAKEATAELGDELFARALRPVLCIARQVTANAMFRRRPMRLMPISA